MSFSMYQASIPVFVHALGNLAGILDKGAAFAETKKFDPVILVNARLAPDMFTLARQVQIATDVVKGGAARLAGVEVPSYADTEASFPELKTRIEKTVSFLKGLSAAQIEGSEDRAISFTAGKRELKFKGQAYLTGFVLPNLYFHSSITYAILRHNGVELGKADFLGNVGG